MKILKEYKKYMKIKKELALAIVHDDGIPDNVKIVEQGEWIDDGKYSFQEIVFEMDGKTYEICNSRSGSYFSDYYYDSEDWGDEVVVTEVRKIEVMQTKWVSVEE